MDSHHDQALDRRTFIHGAATGAAAIALGGRSALAFREQDQAAVVSQIARQHDATVRPLQLRGGVKSYVDFLYSLA